MAKNNNNSNSGFTLTLTDNGTGKAHKLALKLSPNKSKRGGDVYTLGKGTVEGLGWMGGFVLCPDSPEVKEKEVKEKENRVAQSSEVSSLMDTVKEQGNQIQALTALLSKMVEGKGK